MSSISIELNRLAAERWQELEKLLSPIARNNFLKCGISSSILRGKKAIGAYQGNMPKSDVQDWRFHTNVDRIRACYFEIWSPDPTGLVFSLSAAYLHLFDNNDAKHGKEFLAIHTDPASEARKDDDPMPRLKRAPHVHVVCSRSPMHKCHFPLFIANVEQAVSSVRSLTESFRHVIWLIEHDILPHFVE